MAARARRLAAWAACALALGCAGSPVTGGPQPLAVLPAQGSGAAALAVEIAGRGFDAVVRADFTGAAGGAVDARFVAELEPEAGGDTVLLADVALSSRRSLRAKVPAGLATGGYRLRVTDPRGRSGTLEHAFRIVSSTEDVAAFRVDVLEAPRAGVPFAVSISAVDAKGLVVDGFDGSVSIADRTGGIAPATAGPFKMGRVQLQATIPALASADQITVADALGRSGASDPFDVIAGPPAAVVFPQPSSSAAAGACSPRLEIELRDALGHPSPAESSLAVQLQSAPSSITFHAEDGCTTAPITSVTIAPGATRAAFRFRAAVAGTATVRALPATLPSACQDEVVSP